MTYNIYFLLGKAFSYSSCIFWFDTCVYTCVDDSDELNYGIPANDDATKSVQLICGILADAVVEAKGGTLAYAYNVASEDDVSMVEALSTADKAEELRQIRQKAREDAQSSKKKSTRKPTKFVKKVAEEKPTEETKVEETVAEEAKKDKE